MRTEPKKNEKTWMVKKRASAHTNPLRNETGDWSSEVSCGACHTHTHNKK